ncbi:MAG TPA: hypothetical protein ENI23_12050 [bacterium]|nr:hypothetical protein [bacterium]
MNDLFDTPEKKELAVTNFLSLKAHPGWQLLEQIVRANIEVITERIVKGGEKEVMDKLRSDLSAHKNIINTPDDMIKDFREPESSEPSLDPFDKAKVVEED